MDFFKTKGFFDYSSNDNHSGNDHQFCIHRRENNHVFFISGNSKGTFLKCHRGFSPNRVRNLHNFDLILNRLWEHAHPYCSLLPLALLSFFPIASDKRLFSLFTLVVQPEFFYFSHFCPIFDILNGIFSAKNSRAQDSTNSVRWTLRKRIKTEGSVKWS